VEGFDLMSNSNAIDFSGLGSLIDAQPEPVRGMFNYCLAFAMVELGRGRLVGTTPGEAGPICTFETITGEHFSIARPPMSEQQEKRVIRELRRILANASN
jgi:hypothetical protein